MCGIAGAFDIPDASRVVSIMLKALQHRGQEAAGIVSSHERQFYEKRGFGLADEVFSLVNFGQDLPGTMAIGHLRYPTSGEVHSPGAIQPLTAITLHHGPMALVHNGNLTNDLPLREELDRIGVLFRSNGDSELILHLLARSLGDETHKRIRQVFTQIEGAYSLIVMNGERIFVAVDPYGFRPLVMGRMDGGYLIASETCALDLFSDVRDIVHILPGQLAEMGPEGIRYEQFSQSTIHRHCSFEHIYFSRPDSWVFDESVDAVRVRLGQALARRNVIRTDVVIAVPDSSNTIALAYAEEAGLPFRFGLIRNHYTGRTFITPGQPARELGVRMKLNPVRSVVHDKTVTVVDDSLVRGTTGKKVVALLRHAGAKEVHLRIGSPAVISPCYWGIDTPEREQLAAAEKSVEEIRTFMEADSLDYLTLEELREALQDKAGAEYCTSCFTGLKPIEDQRIPPEHLSWRARRG